MSFLSICLALVSLVFCNFQYANMCFVKFTQKYFIFFVTIIGIIFYLFVFKSWMPCSPSTGSAQKESRGASRGRRAQHFLNPHSCTLTGSTWLSRWGFMGLGYWSLLISHKKTLAVQVQRSASWSGARAPGGFESVWLVLTAVFWQPFSGTFVVCQSAPALPRASATKVLYFWFEFPNILSRI